MRTRLVLEDFGDPTYVLDEPPPSMVLLSSGMPSNQVAGVSFIVDFVVIDPTGQRPHIAGMGRIMVMRTSDDALHPDAQVTPSDWFMTNGHVSATITIQATTSLANYTLGLGLTVGTSAGFQGVKANAFLPMPSDAFLNRVRPRFDLGAGPLTTDIKNKVLEKLEDLRKTMADPVTSWLDPMPGFSWCISGTFGEWRGDNDTRSHHGVDLGTAGTDRHRSESFARRGGVQMGPRFHNPGRLCCR